MLKNQKIEILNECIKTPRNARVYFEFDPDYYYYYPNAANGKFFVGQEENDFLLDGYHIRRITHIKKAEIKDDLCTRSTARTA